MPSAIGGPEDGDEQLAARPCRAAAARPPRRSWPSDGAAARRPRACRARTPGRRRRRAGWRSSSRSAACRGRGATRASSTARPGARRPRRVARPRSRPARRAAPRSRATVRVSTPSDDQERVAEVRARARRGRGCGLRPTSPQQAAGMRIEPPPSLPCAIGHHARPRPPPPSRRTSRPACASRSHGLRVGAGVARLGGRQDPELRHVRRCRRSRSPPRAAAGRGRRCASGRWPREEASSRSSCTGPSTGTLALIAIGTPANGRGSPGCDRVRRGERPLAVDLDERVRARRRAPRCARARPRTSSRAVSSPPRTRAASSPAGVNMRSAEAIAGAGSLRRSRAR